MIGKRVVRRCFLMSGLKDVANTKFSERGVTSAYGTIQVTELRNAFWEQPLSSVLLNHAQHKSVIGDCSNSVRSALRAPLLFRSSLPAKDVALAGEVGLEEQSALPANLKCVGSGPLRDRVLATGHRMPRYVESSVTHIALVCCWSVPACAWRSWSARFSQALASVATVSQVKQRRQPKRGTVRIM